MTCKICTQGTKILKFPHLVFSRLRDRVEQKTFKSSLTDRSLGHELKSLQGFCALRCETKLEWHKKFPNVPFDVTIEHLTSHPEELGKETSALSYDIKAAALR